MRDHTNVIDWLVPFLEEHNIGVEAFSFQADVTKNALYNFISGKSKPRPETLMRIYQAAVEINGGPLSAPSTTEDTPLEPN